MEFKAIFAITMCFCMGFLMPRGLQKFSTPDWATAEKGDLPKAPTGAEGKASSLPCPLDQLWAFITQPYETSRLCVACEIVFLHCLAGIALYLWRNMKKPQGQGRGWPATSPMGTVRRKGRTFSRDQLELLRRLDINTGLMFRRQRLWHRRNLQEIWHQLSGN